MGAVIVFFSAPTEGFHLLVVLLAAESLYLSVLTKKKKVWLLWCRGLKKKNIFRRLWCFWLGDTLSPLPCPLLHLHHPLFSYLGSPPISCGCPDHTCLLIRRRGSLCSKWAVKVVHNDAHNDLFLLKAFFFFGQTNCILASRTSGPGKLNRFRPCYRNQPSLFRFVSLPDFCSNKPAPLMFLMLSCYIDLAGMWF